MKKERKEEEEKGRNPVVKCKEAHKKEHYLDQDFRGNDDTFLVLRGRVDQNINQLAEFHISNLKGLLASIVLINKELGALSPHGNLTLLLVNLGFLPDDHQEGENN